MFVFHGGTPTWRLHTGGSILHTVQNISTNIWRLVERTDLKLGQVSSLPVSYNITISWLHPLNGFRFIFILGLYCVKVQVKNNPFKRLLKPRINPYAFQNSQVRQDKELFRCVQLIHDWLNCFVAKGISCLISSFRARGLSHERSIVGSS